MEKRQHIGVSSDSKDVDVQEFQEEDVWMIFQETEDPGNHDSSRSSHDQQFQKIKNPGKIFRDESSLITKHLSNTVSSKMTMIPDKTRFTSQETKNFHHSAPVNIPDWSKIYGLKASITNNNVYEEDEDSSEEDGVITPPHEWIAKKLSRRNLSSFSVFEGVGRTLKGRDLSRVRNAVLIKTGFLEPKLDHDSCY